MIAERLLVCVMSLAAGAGCSIINRFEDYDIPEAGGAGGNLGKEAEYEDSGGAGRGDGSWDGSAGAQALSKGGAPETGVDSGGSDGVAGSGAALSGKGGMGGDAGSTDGAVASAGFRGDALQEAGGDGAGGSGTAGATVADGGVDAGTAGAGATAGSPATTPPTIDSVTPGNGAQGVRADTAIVVAFSKAMDRQSVQAALTLSGVLPGDLALAWNAAGTVLTVTPSNGLSYATGTDPSAPARSYTLTVSTGAGDLEGRALGEAYVSSFTTLKRISQSLSPTVTAYYYTYGVSESGAIPLCERGLSYRIGYTVSPVTSGANHGLLAFDTGLPSAIVGLESAELQASQSVPEGDFYASNVVTLDQLEYQQIDPTVLDASVKADLGTFCSSADVSTPSMDITSVLAVDLADGARSFLYRFSASGGVNNTYAVFHCEPYSLNVVYLLP